MKKEIIHSLSVISFVLLICVSVIGVFSWGTEKAYTSINQYGETIKMWGNGIYYHDSFFKAPIFIGSDLVMLLVTSPLLLVFVMKDRKEKSDKSRLLLVSVLIWILYYSTSLCFGVTYNKAFLLYILLFSVSFFGVIVGILDVAKRNYRVPEFMSGKAFSIFLLISGISTFIAWFPDILASFSTGTLDLIEVYTTEITYVLDMGIISPTAFICFYFLKKKNAMGFVLMSVLSIGIIIVGVMMISQTAFQISAHIDVPIPALITKSLIFLLLGIYAAVLTRKMYNTNL